MSRDFYIRTLRSEYDLIVSLGGSCNAAMQLRHRGMRFCSMPLDWTLMTNVKPLEMLPVLIGTKFKDFCLHGNMVEFEPPVEDHGKIRCRLDDRYSGYRFIHQFTPPVADVKHFEQERNIQMRRVERFYSQISAAHNVLFVLGTGFEYSIELAQDIFAALEEAFTRTKVEMAVLQFCATAGGLLDLCDGRLHIARYERSTDTVYDNILTAPEWRFLDSLDICGKLSIEKTRKRIPMKLVYKLWMKLGKWLENHNTGCANMRFYKFREC